MQVNTLGSMHGVFTDPWMVDFYGFHVGKNSQSSHGSVMGNKNHPLKKLPPIWGCERAAAPFGQGGGFFMGT